MVSRNSVRRGKRFGHGGFLGRLLIATMALTAGMGLVFIPSASAESERVTYINGARVGFNSKPWVDTNLDNKPTLVHFVNCTSNPEVELWKDINLLPDVRIGAPKVAWCLNTNGNWLDWGDVGSGTFYFKISDLRSTRSTLDVEYVHIAW